MRSVLNFGAGMASATPTDMKDTQTPHNQEGEPPTQSPKETAERLEQKADEQEGESNRARTEDKAREAKHREVRFGG
jgi:hypothetical protein